MNEIKELAEKYLGTKIGQEVFEAELTQAKHKLDRIIRNEGDANGERKKPYYIAQLVAEIIKSDILTIKCMVDYEDKKRAAHRGQLT